MIIGIMVDFHNSLHVFLYFQAAVRFYCIYRLHGCMQHWRLMAQQHQELQRLHAAPAQRSCSRQALAAQLLARVAAKQQQPQQQAHAEEHAAASPGSAAASDAGCSTSRASQQPTTANVHSPASDAAPGPHSPASPSNPRPSKAASLARLKQRLQRGGSNAGHLAADSGGAGGCVIDDRACSSSGRDQGSKPHGITLATHDLREDNSNSAGPCCSSEDSGSVRRSRKAHDLDVSSAASPLTGIAAELQPQIKRQRHNPASRRSSADAAGTCSTADPEAGEPSSSLDATGCEADGTCTESGGLRRSDGGSGDPHARSDNSISSGGGGGGGSGNMKPSHNDSLGVAADGRKARRSSCSAESACTLGDGAISTAPVSRRVSAASAAAASPAPSRRVSVSGSVASSSTAASSRQLASSVANSTANGSTKSVQHKVPSASVASKAAAASKKAEREAQSAAKTALIERQQARESAFEKREQQVLSDIARMLAVQQAALAKMHSTRRTIRR